VWLYLHSSHMPSWCAEGQLYMYLACKDCFSFNISSLFMFIFALLEIHVQGIMSKIVLCNITHHIHLIILFKDHFIWDV